MMNPDEHASIESRIAALERANRRTRIASVGFASLFALAMLTGQAPPNETVIGDAQGQHLRLVPSGIFVYDQAGKQRAFLGVYSDGGSGLSVNDQAGVVRTFDGVLTSNGSIMQVYDTQGKGRIKITFENNTPGLMEFGPNGNTTLQATSGTAGGYLRTGDNQQELRTYIGVYSQGTSGVAAYGTNGVATWSSPSQ